MATQLPKIAFGETTSIGDNCCTCEMRKEMKTPFLNAFKTPQEVDNTVNSVENTYVSILLFIHVHLHSFLCRGNS